MVSTMPLCLLLVGVEMVCSSWRAVQQYPFTAQTLTKTLLCVWHYALWHYAW